MVWRNIFLGVLASFVVAASCSGQDVAVEPAAPPVAVPTTKPAKVKPATPPVKTESAILTEQLSSADPAAQQAAIDRIKEMLSKPAEVDDDGVAKPASRARLSSAWLPALLKAKRFDDVESIAVQGMVHGAGELKLVSPAQKARVQAFLNTGKHNEALAAAKAYYNVCSMAETEGAIDLLSLCLINARSSEKGIARKFKVQQIALATTQPSTMPSADAATDTGENILKSISVDAKTFEPAIKQITLSNYSNLVAKGNLLLLCDRAKEAKECFESAADLAKGEKEMMTITEGIARSIRAETGAIGPANAYIIAQQGQ